jgi:acetate kinase
VSAIGHRVVHGGDVYTEPTRITGDVIAGIEALSTLAPLHNPLALDVIHACREFFHNAVPMVAVFDTAFHAHMPAAARCYAVPADWARAYGIRRYGFHGLAHRSMVERFRRLSGDSPPNPRVITLQLGHGCSVAAIRGGESIDTSMGYTPLEGLVMATRSGDVDPGALIRLAAEGVGAAELDARLNRESGLLALSGVSGDMQALLTLEAEGHDGARLAIEVFCLRARKYLGAYMALLGGADAVLFGGGIGEHAASIRERICASMQWSGLRLDSRANASAVGTERRISTNDSRPVAYAIRVDEEALIAQDTHQLLNAV